MTPAQLDDLAALEAMATPGPWEVRQPKEDGFEREVTTDDGTNVALLESAYDEQDAKDAELIAAARNALPELLAMARDRDRYLAALKVEACDKAEEHANDDPRLFTIGVKFHVGHVAFLVTESPDGSLEAEEVK